jgi:hypothetical protein
MDKPGRPSRDRRGIPPIPAGTLTADCGWCGAAVWVTANNHARATGPGGRVACIECVRKAAGGGGEVPRASGPAT